MRWQNACTNYRCVIVIVAIAEPDVRMAEGTNRAPDQGRRRREDDLANATLFFFAVAKRSHALGRRALDCTDAEFCRCTHFALLFDI